MGVCGAGKTLLVPSVLVLCMLLPAFYALALLPARQTAQVRWGIAYADG